MGDIPPVMSKKRVIQTTEKGEHSAPSSKKKGDFYEKVDDPVGYSGGNFGYGGYFRRR